MILLSVGVAIAGPDAATLERLAAELAPRVEAAAGRRFVVPPEILSIPSVRLDEVAFAHRPRPLLPPGAPQPVRSPALADVHSPMLTLSSGVVVVLEDGVAPLLDGWPAELHEGVLACVMAHELVHTLQMQHLSVVEPGASVLEGHAALVSAEVCRERIGELGQVWLDQRTNVTTALPRHRSTAVEHAWGPLVVRSVPRDLWWAALAAPPPPQEIDHAVMGVLSPDWPHGLAEGAPAPYDLGPFDHASAASILAPLAGRVPGLDPVPVTAAGWVSQFGDPPTRGVLAVYLLSDAQSAASLLEDRVSRVRARAPIPVLRGMDAFETLPARRRTVHTTADGAVWRDRRTGLREEWHVTGSIVVVHSTGRGGPSLSEREIDQVLAREPWVPPVRLPDDALRAWRASLTAVPPQPQGSPAFHLQRALRASEAGDGDACARIFGPLSGSGPEYLRMGLRCAVVRGELDAAVALHAELPRPDADADFELGMGLWRGGRRAAAAAAFAAADVTALEAIEGVEFLFPLLHRVCADLGRADTGVCSRGWGPAEP